MPKPGQKMYWTIGWAASKERREFDEYSNKGGGLGFNAWLRQGKPAPPSALTIRGKKGFGETVRGLPIEEQQWLMGEEIAPKLKEEKEKKEKETAAEKAERERLEDIAYERGMREKEFAEKQRQFDESQRIKTYTQFGVNPYDIPETPEEEGQWNPYQGQWEAPQGWISPYQQGQLSLQEKQMEQQRLQDEAMMGWYREQAQFQREEQERQYRSQLMANPMSWLQYSAYTGQAPVVQEWMKPLMSGQYQAGQQIPGWTSGQGEGQAMGSLPELRTPSAQLWGRMGPTAQAQYMGYGQARTGIRPEESMFRLGATAPPSGRFGGLRRMR